MGEIRSVPSFDNVQQRLSASPTLRRAHLEIERRRSLVDVEHSKRIPDVTFSLGVKRPNELQRDQLLFGVSVPLPVFDRMDNSEDWQVHVEGIAEFCYANPVQSVEHGGITFAEHHFELIPE